MVVSFATKNNIYGVVGAELQNIFWMRYPAPTLLKRNAFSRKGCNSE